MTNPRLIDFANQIIDQLIDKVIIHRYDSYSTNSIYLKFDYGVARSLRISDHTGKKHLKYRFNLIESQAGTPHCVILNNNFPMNFYPPEEIDILVKDILSGRQRQITKYRDYQAVMNKAKLDAEKQTKGFWTTARLIQSGKEVNVCP